MHERDLQQRPEWSQKVVNAIVKAQIWVRANRAKTVRLLSNEGQNRYTPHAIPVLEKVLAPPARRDRRLREVGSYPPRRLAGKPYRFPALSLSQLHRGTGAAPQGYIDRGRSCLPRQPRSKGGGGRAGGRPLRQGFALAATGGLPNFGLPNSFTRTEVFAP